MRKKDRPIKDVLSPQTFTKKMRGATIFDIEEANNLGDFLEMTGKEKIDIFLS